jgi:cytochrome c-type biogenesis protein CcmE
VARAAGGPPCRPPAAAVLQVGDEHSYAARPSRGSVPGLVGDFRAAPGRGRELDRKRLKFIVGGAIISAAVLYLVFSGFQEAVLFHYTVGELLSEGSASPRGARVGGTVVAGSIARGQGDPGIRFRMTSGGSEMDVRYAGFTPDIFGEGVDVVVEGKYDGRTFQAETLMAKCPSKYEGQEFDETRHEEMKQAAR